MHKLFLNSRKQIIAKLEITIPFTTGKTLFSPLIGLFIRNNILKVKIGFDVEILGGEQDADISRVSLQCMHLGQLGASGVSSKGDLYFSLGCLHNSAQLSYYNFFTTTMNYSV